MSTLGGLLKETDIEIKQVRFLVTNISHFLRFLRTVADENACHLILFDTAKMAGKKHVIASMSHAMRSFADGTCISNSLEMEALLYAAGTRQTNIAMQFGIHGGINRSYLCCVPRTARAWTALRSQMTEEDEDWEVFSAEKEARLAELFGITCDEREAAGRASLQDLIIERVALLEVLK
jgi:KEOPS complex subunit Cgi121